MNKEKKVRYGFKDFLYTIGMTLMGAFYGFLLGLLPGGIGSLTRSDFWTTLSGLLILGGPVVGFFGSFWDLKCMREQEEKDRKSAEEAKRMFQHSLNNLLAGYKPGDQLSMQRYENACSTMVWLCETYFRNPFVNVYDYIYEVDDCVFLNRRFGEYVRTNQSVEEMCREAINKKYGV